jgi:hypothetical protein
MSTTLRWFLQVTFFWVRLISIWASMFRPGRLRKERFPCLNNRKILPSGLYIARLGLALTKIMGGDVDIELEPLYRYQAANKVKAAEGSRKDT